MESDCFLSSRIWRAAASSPPRPSHQFDAPRFLRQHIFGELTLLLGIRGVRREHPWNSVNSWVIGTSCSASNRLEESCLGTRCPLLVLLLEYSALDA